VENWLASHAKPIFDSLLYSAIGAAFLFLCLWVANRIVPFSIKKEIVEDQNVGLGIIMGAFVLGIALIISAAIRG
jgi:uncharacterized membrane protein YjfL (UPF0719 family)